MLWLEETKIRHYTMEQRAGLRKIDSEKEWGRAFNAYLKDLGYDHAEIRHFGDAELRVAMEWLVVRAVSLEYSDKKGIYNAKAPCWTRRGKAAIMLSERNLTLLREIVSLLGMRVDGVNDTHRQVSLILSEMENKFNRMATLNAMKASSKQGVDTIGPKDVKLSSENCAVGLSTGNSNLDQACRLLRLAFIKKLRLFQDRINRGLAQAQNITANPKTNTKLGKVGYL